MGVGAEKYRHTLSVQVYVNFKILTILLMMRKFRLLVKFDEKFLHGSYFIGIYKCESGMVVENQVRDSEDTGSRPACVV
jgi:hypothetical protein